MKCIVRGYCLCLECQVGLSRTLLAEYDSHARTSQFPLKLLSHWTQCYHFAANEPIIQSGARSTVWRHPALHGHWESVLPFGEVSSRKSGKSGKSVKDRRRTGQTLKTPYLHVLAAHCALRNVFWCEHKPLLLDMQSQGSVYTFVSQQRHHMLCVTSAKAFFPAFPPLSLHVHATDCMHNIHTPPYSLTYPCSFPPTFSSSSSG
jgi:hypothetical protein